MTGGEITIICEILLDSEIRQAFDENALTLAMSREAQELCRQLMERYGDVFGIAEALGCEGETLSGVAVKVVFE